MNNIDSFETSKFNKRVWFNEHETQECKDSIVWRKPQPNHTNPRFKHFNQSIYHAGDVVDLYRYGIIYSHFLDRQFKRIKKKILNIFNLHCIENCRTIRHTIHFI